MEILNINGIKTHLLPDSRLKTATATLYINVPLRKETASFNAIWPAVLMRGSKNHPETKDFTVCLEQMFGANAGFKVEKQGAYQRISLRFKTVADKYAENEPFSALLRFMGEVLLSPSLDNGAFRKSYTEREKEVQIQYIEGIVNDKRKYASVRLIEEMCKGEEYSILACGDIDSIKKIDEKTLYESYINALKSAEISLYVTDNFEKEKVVPILKEIFKDFKNNAEERINPEIKDVPGAVNNVEETAKITQGKLAMGFRTDITRQDERYYAMAVFNKLFGGAPYSKLFLNVREKLSLAYYASSTYNSLKGLVLVNSGIEISNFSQAKNEILRQLKALANGDFTEDDINSAKLDIKDSYKGISDYGEALSEYYSFCDIAGAVESPEEVVEKINKVTKEQITEVAKTVKLDTVYFLKGEE